MTTVSVLHRPCWRTAGVCEDKQEVLDVLVFEAVSYLFSIWQSQLPLSKWRLAEYSSPAPGVAAAGAYDSVNRRGSTPDCASAALFGETQMRHWYFEG